jgi:hypothetical protein
MKRGANNKFISTLTNSNADIKAVRAKMINEDALDASEELLRSLKQEKREMERQLMNLSDMSPESELSLMVVKPNFDAKSWIANIQRLKVELANKQVEIDLAEETHNEWFGKEEVTDETA